MPTLRELLHDWTDFDLAGHALGRILGVLPDKPWDPVADKHIFWSRHAVGEFLVATLHKLVRLGVLEHQDDGLFRWKAS